MSMYFSDITYTNAKTSIFESYDEINKRSDHFERTFIVEKRNTYVYKNKGIDELENPRDKYTEHFCNIGQNLGYEFYLFEPSEIVYRYQ